MPQSTSSAQPEKLYHYSDRAIQIDQELAAESHGLGSALARFQAACTEYRVPVSYLAERVRYLADAAGMVDRWVHSVGQKFLEADQITSIWWAQEVPARQWSFLDRLKLIWSPAVVLRPLKDTISWLLARRNGETGWIAKGVGTVEGPLPTYDNDTASSGAESEQAHLGRIERIIDTRKMQCVGWVREASKSLWGINPPFSGNASGWSSQIKNGKKWQRSEKLHAPAIAAKDGHVFFVEGFDEEGRVMITEANWPENDWENGGVVRRRWLPCDDKRLQGAVFAWPPDARAVSFLGHELEGIDLTSEENASSAKLKGT